MLHCVQVLSRSEDWWDSGKVHHAVIYAVDMVSKTKENYQNVLSDGDVDDKDLDPDLHEFKSHILAAKASVTPLNTGLTIPRAKVSELVLCSKFISKAVLL